MKFLRLFRGPSVCQKFLSAMEFRPWPVSKLPRVFLYFCLFVLVLIAQWTRERAQWRPLINSKGSRLTTVQPPLRFETKSTHAICSHGFELRGEINHFQVEKRSGSLTFQLWRARVVSGLHLNLVSPWRAQLWYETPRAYGSLQVFLG